MNQDDLWHISDLPVHLLMWMLNQPWCLGQSPEGVVTICWAMPPHQAEWRIDSVDPREGFPLRLQTHVFAVDHERHTISYRRTLEGKP